ncbi:MAG: Holliday junction resolvase RuvX [Candidatus Shapirobacteria bacterium]|nr:Holliday junction resolvase RuvX [Candidatus Shapirobacteria bacterium]MDD5073695.1 Holliday junction resolvase RuvX [Candidatus Shapirobacteria bacterium]MDD5481784.1 Holliday junction resolvase RuvX [Candidatus Shapirobacteria bacterium]
MRYLGIDYGKKRIGLAFGERGLVCPLTVYQNNNNVFDKIQEICLNEAVDRVVLGMSQDLKKEIEFFAQGLAKRIGLPIVFQDESLTTREAVDKMLVSSTRQRARREKIDAIAAAQILTAYFLDKKD